MPIPSPFHARTQPLCESYRWKDWAGYIAVCAYSTYAEREYQAFRHTAGMIDVTPLFKYEVHGPEASAFLSRVMAKNIEKLKVGQVTYCCWCDDHGKVVDDGTVSRLEDQYFRVTAAEPTYFWFMRHAETFDVTIEDSSTQLGALAVQGPLSRDILASAAQTSLDDLRFFRLMQTKIAGNEVIITRTGYTGDLGYEVWVRNDGAPAVWDAIMESGAPYRLLPCGLDALDMTRIEAGFIMNGVDYYSSHHCFIESRKSTPYELDLGWSVNLKRDSFIGQAALQKEKAEGPKRYFVGLVYDWDEFEALFKPHGLPAEVHPGAWRDAVPVYDQSGAFVGQATSGSWSPILKKNLALATVNAGHHREGTKLKIETTVEYERKTVTATVTSKPFFNPERKRA